MPTILLLMQRKAILQTLSNTLKEINGIVVINEINYNTVHTFFNELNPGTALIEVAEFGDYDIHYCLKLCEILRKQCSSCKLLLMCPEQDYESVNLVVKAKGNNDITDFVFYDVTIDYLISKLLTI